LGDSARLTAIFATDSLHWCSLALNEIEVLEVVQEAPAGVEAELASRHPGADRLATVCVVDLIRTAGLLVAARNSRFRRFGLTGSTFTVLLILDAAPGPLAPHELGERLLVTRGTVTGLLDTLQKLGLVNRVPHPVDRRMLLIELTDAGRDLLGKVAGVHFPAQTGMVSGLSDDEKRTLVRLLDKLHGHLVERSRDRVSR
jgi:DNA-binding MarR family transcriptional regulator